MNYYGYVTSRKIGPMMIPVPTQNSALREFVQRKCGIYILPSLESRYINCFHQLFGLIQSVPTFGSVVMYSVLMLPRGDKLKKLQKISNTKEISFGFALENVYSELNDIVLDEIKTYNLQNYVSRSVNLKKYFE